MPFVARTTDFATTENEDEEVQQNISDIQPTVSEAVYDDIVNDSEYDVTEKSNMKMEIGKFSKS